jgi:hypothetical protein
MTEDAGRKSPISECHGPRMRATQYPPRSTYAQKLVNFGYWVARTSRTMTGPA